MAFQSVPDTAEAVIVGTTKGVVVSMTHYCKYSGVYTETNLQELADAYDNWVGDHLLPLLSVEYVYNGTFVRGLDAMNDLERFSIANAGPGLIPGDSLPNSIAFCVKRVSEFTGRSARGRVYVPGIAASDLAADENFLGATQATAFVTAHSDIVDDLVGTGWSQVVVSRYSGGVKRATGVTFPVIAWFKSNDRVDSRRDRMP